ncbi:hypothetical protein TWF703_004211 [Orbilia oligospora]|uniref:Uncharacterized protein n=1 Tax=Orbilia oligospora TaxID=2813651 RepID=A0A7C8JEJ5_ORBOL|nr:hypothetical protein TWF703_004211 [Orbilia oligospora]
MSRDLFGEFGDFQSGGTTTTTGGGGGSSTTTNNAFSTASSYATQPNASGNSNFDDLLGLFNSPAPPPSSLSSTTTYPASQFNNNNNNNNDNNNVIINNNKSLHPNFQSTTSEAIISGQIFTNTHNSNSNSNYHSNPTASTTLFTTSPNQNPIFDDDDDDDDFGDFAVEPLPSTNPTFGPLSNNSPPQKPSIPTILHPQEQNKNHDDNNNNNDDDDDDFGTFISTPRIPTPPPTFSLSSTITNTNYLHPLHPPPALHALLPLLTTQLLSPSPFLTRLKPLSYPAKQRLLTSVKVKTFFISIIMVSHVVGRIIAGRKIRGRRSYKGKGIENGSNGNNKKNEGLKDEREVGECVREYNEIVGSLRAVVRGMGVVVVELSGEMSISSTNTSTSTLSSGNKKGKKGSSSNTTTGITEFCWLCGLSPVDKVVKLKEDESIEVGKDIDGGERWVSGWGHRGCRNWWGECGGRFGV